MNQGVGGQEGMDPSDYYLIKQLFVPVGKFCAILRTYSIYSRIALKLDYIITCQNGWNTTQENPQLNRPDSCKTTSNKKLPQ